MASLGKQTVTIRSFLNGRFSNVRTQNRVVYQDSSGKYYVSHLGQTYGREITRTPTGFLWEIHVTQIASRGIADVIAGLVNRRE